MNGSMKNLILGAIALVVPALFVATSLSAAASRLAENAGAETGVAVAAAAEDSYCTPALKAIIRRVAGSCGLIANGSGGRGCQPMEARKVAALSDNDFNALFRPLSSRAHIIQFDPDQVDLDEGARAEIEKAWADQRGASFFFVVSRASTDGAAEHNEELSRKRAEGVLGHLEAKFQDPELKKEVGLLWLGESFAQLGDDFCTWQRSRAGECNAKDINRSAFVAWIDCAI
jgi:outer membrane protein OmpA-like peptidoglycan-associated protein